MQNALKWVQDYWLLTWFRPVPKPRPEKVGLFVPWGHTFLMWQGVLSQSRQSAKPFLQSSELGLPPTPHPQASVPRPPCFWGEGNTRWRERGWESPNSDESHTLWYSLYVRTLWVLFYFCNRRLAPLSTGLTHDIDCPIGRGRGEEELFI